LHVGDNILNWSRCRIHRDGICAIEELYSGYIDEDMRVGSGAYDTLDAVREHHKAILVSLESIYLHVGNNEIM
jgi:hypothetical protein